MSRQHALRAILTEQFNVRADLLPPPLIFNPAHPEESQRLLEDSMRAALGRSQERLRQQLEEIAAQARDHSRTENLVFVPAEERKDAIQDMQEVQQQAEHLVKEATRGFASLIEAVAVEEPTSLSERALTVVKLVAPAGVLFGRVHSLTRMLQETALNPEEACAHDLLMALAVDDQVDFSMFEKRLQEEVPATNSWQILQSLTQKSRVRVRIQLVRG